MADKLPPLKDIREAFSEYTNITHWDGCWKFHVRCTFSILCNEIERLRKITEPIDRLRENEGASVLICCDNPDFNGLPNCAVEITDGWTDWETLRFTGETVPEALANAEKGRKEGREVMPNVS